MHIDRSCEAHQLEAGFNSMLNLHCVYLAAACMQTSPQQEWQDIDASVISHQIPLLQS
jgi:hypothetical protein